MTPHESQTKNMPPEIIPPAGPGPAGRPLVALTGEALARAVHQAAGCMGWLLPQTEQEVERAQGELLLAPGELPAALRDADAILQRHCRLAPATLLFGGQARIGSDLARAAREAGRIMPEIEQAMRRDRREAEDEKGLGTGH